LPSPAGFVYIRKYIFYTRLDQHLHSLGIPSGKISVGKKMKKKREKKKKTFRWPVENV